MFPVYGSLSNQKDWHLERTMKTPRNRFRFYATHPLLENDDQEWELANALFDILEDRPDLWEYWANVEEPYEDMPPLFPYDGVA